jgi:hypothetical protein
VSHPKLDVSDSWKKIWPGKTGNLRKCRERTENWKDVQGYLLLVNNLRNDAEMNNHLVHSWDKGITDLQMT